MLTHHHSSPVQPARVVVLGARGFVASSLVAHLQAARVNVLTLSAADLDLTSPESADALAAALRPEDALVFVSALTPDKGKDIATLMKNLEMGRNVSAALAASPCAHVVYVSTDAVYHDDASLVHEQSPCQPSSFHGVTHVVRERMLIETLRPSRIPLAILRPTLLYGAGDTHNGYGPNRFLRQALAGKAIPLFGGGEEQRDYVLVDDVSRLVGLVLAHKSEGLLNVATGTSISFAEVAALASELSGQDVPIQPSPRSNAITHRHFDIAETLAAFPTFGFTPLRDGLTAMTAALRNRT